MEKTSKTLETLHTKIQDMLKSPCELRKIFAFSLEDLADNPSYCIEQITSYLEEHADKILDYRLESHYNEDTLKPEIYMYMKLIEDFKMIHNPLWITVLHRIDEKLPIFRKNENFK
jgi:hypothetical protein